MINSIIRRTDSEIPIQQSQQQRVIMTNTTTIYHHNDFILNKYQKLYFNIINKAQSEPRKKGEGVYYENHHIIPKSMGGSNDSSNLVLLSGREHFICHYLLTKFSTSDKMLLAFNMMKSNNTEFRYINSKLFESNKKRIAAVLRNRMNDKKFALRMKTMNKGRIHSEETRHKMSVSKRGIRNHQFRGHFKTPYGVFTNSRSAETNLLSYSTIKRWCYNSSKLISKQSIGSSKYLQSLTESPLGKSYKEIGFTFVPR